MTGPITFSVEVALLTVVDGSLAVLLRRREAEPFAGRWALPGGPVLPEEDLDEQAPSRLLRDAGVSAPPGSLEQLRTYGRPDRDPRGRAVSTAYLGLLPSPRSSGADGSGSGASLTAGSRWRPVGEVADAELAFDHAAILADAVERTRAKLEYSALATCFVSEPFTIAELRAVYEAVWNTSLDPAQFRRGVLSVEGFVEPVPSEDEEEAAGAGQRFRRGPAALLHPAMLRPALPRPGRS